MVVLNFRKGFFLKSQIHVCSSHSLDCSNYCVLYHFISLLIKNVELFTQEISCYFTPTNGSISLAREHNVIRERQFHFTAFHFPKKSYGTDKMIRQSDMAEWTLMLSILLTR